MFKVLVTTAAQVVAQSSMMTGGIPAASIAVHTQVLEFPTREAADLAVGKINQKRVEVPTSIFQNALPLY